MKQIFLFCLVITLGSCQEKEIYQFEVKEGDGFLNAIPVILELDYFKNIADDDYMIFNDGEPVSYQRDKEGQKLWFLHHPDKKASYSLKKVERKLINGPDLSTTKDNGNLQLSIKNSPLVQYRYEMMHPPPGVDSLYKKSGYIHPIITPKGDTLTRIQPPDHYHHYGLWGPWTHTQVDGERVDFWNLGQGMGTVLFKEFRETRSGNIFTSFTAAQEHIDLKTANAPQVALKEDLKVQLWNLDRPDRYMLDYTTTFTSPLESGILFEAYRYGGGIGLRFNERWHKDNCSVLTSEGKDRLTADGSNARWCIVSGASSDGQGTHGILFLSHPENRMHPEPMRIWPMDANGGRGDMFFEFCPIRHEEWKIEPVKEYELNYRMVVFDGELKAEEAEAYWQTFANPPKVQMIKE
ncbi:DUF6807 domain-containing protein [Ulvibacterium marinum]|uniref:Methane oxygenase PmoA n=1 Tax=Ulvibacterium marinum TaxID=2419782 RepID=A0A3B0BVA3_9FLAO|nr:PmoA family protein [Ulvibacterium marinum]RKN76740.1 hypothetical protein D7Z94_23400 [Ulvibacterium marinum]